jgi:hypothetical protein
MSDDEDTGGEDSESTLSLAMICMGTPVLPLAKALQAELDALGDGPGLVNPEVQDETLTFDFDGAMGFVSLMPAPIPWTDLEGPCATAWYWPEATEVLKGHTAHLIVTLTGNPGDAIDRHLRLTRLVAATANASQALGVYWGGAPLVQPREGFSEVAKEAARDNLPLELWVEQRVFSNAHEKFSVFTAGMDKLGVMEIEVRDTSGDASDVMSMIYGLAQYLVLNGNAIADGDTVGQSEEQKIIARHVDSEWERPGKVLLLEIE